MALMDRRQELAVAALPTEVINSQATLAHMLPLVSKFDSGETHNDRLTPPPLRPNPADNLNSNLVAFSSNQMLPARTIAEAAGDVVMESSRPSPTPSEHAPSSDSELVEKDNVADVDKITASMTPLAVLSSKLSNIESNSEDNSAGAEVPEQSPGYSFPPSTSGVSAEYVPMNQNSASAPVLADSVMSDSVDDSANPTSRDPASPISSAAAEESSHHLETDSGLTATNAVRTTSPQTPQKNQDLDFGHVGISQLAIDRGSQIVLSLDSGPSDDVLMTDAPVVVKVVREREYDADDAIDEPATKRARTDSAEKAPHAEMGAGAKTDPLTEIQADTQADAQADAQSARQANPQAHMRIDTPAGTLAETPADSQAEVQFAFTIDSLPRWLEPAVVSQSINDVQRKQYRHFLQLAKKTTGGASFRDSVERLWPSIWNEYEEKVPNPMDISEMDRRMRDGGYQTLGPFMMDLALIYTNCALFNGADHQLTAQAQGVVETIWSRVLKAESDDTPTSKSNSKGTGATRQVEPRAAKLQKAQAQPPPPPPPQTQAQVQVPASASASAHGHTQAHHQRPSRHANGQEAISPSSATGHSRETALSRRQSTTAAMSPTERSTEQTYAVPPGGVPQIRRASTATDASRPKRAIQPPKSKDIDYISAKNAKKNLRPELQFCEAVLSEVMDEKNVALNGPFQAPVDPVALGIPTYFNIIKKPMDLSTISKTLLSGQYNNAKQFDTDMRLMFRNCFRFNGEADLVYKQGKSLEALYDAEYKRKTQWMARHALPTRSTVAPADSDEENSEEEEDEEPAATSRVALIESSARTNETIQVLQSKLSEEMMKLTAMFAEPKPNSSLIQLQESMIQQVKQSLLNEKEKQTTQKSEKVAPSKTSSAKQAAKSRSRAGGGGGKKAVPAASAGGAVGGGGGSGVARKGVGSGGMTKKSSAASNRRVLTSDETQYVAETMSNLDSPYLEDAIAIIKRDTGQDENLDGELELEIEVLSTDAMLRLYDICQKSKAAQNPPPSTTLSRNLAPKPKKNKPMSKTEQERKIRELRHLEARFQAQRAGSPPQDDSMEGIQSPAAAPVESSDDDESSEEE